jgi:hypothetical protein
MIFRQSTHILLGFRVGGWGLVSGLGLGSVLICQQSTHILGIRYATHTSDVSESQRYPLAPVLQVMAAVHG